MNIEKHINHKNPRRFVAEDLSSPAAKRLFLSYSVRKQIAKIQLFLLGHNTECFSPEPVYGPTGNGALRSRGVEGLKRDNSLLEHFDSNSGIDELERFRKAVLNILQQSLSSNGKPFKRVRRRNVAGNRNHKSRTLP